MKTRKDNNEFGAVDSEDSDGSVGNYMLIIYAVGFGGALLGGVIWVSIVYFTSFETALMGVGIPYLCVFGLRYASRDTSGDYGIEATIITTICSLIAIMVIYQVIAIPKAKEMFTQQKPADVVVEAIRHNENLFFIFVCLKMVEDHDMHEETAHYILVQADDSQKNQTPPGRIVEIEQSRQKVCELIDNIRLLERDNFIRTHYPKVVDEFTGYALSRYGRVELIKLWYLDMYSPLPLRDQGLMLLEPVWFFLLIFCAWRTGSN